MRVSCLNCAAMPVCDTNYTVHLSKSSKASQCYTRVGVVVIFHPWRTEQTFVHEVRPIFSAYWTIRWRTHLWSANCRLVNSWTSQLAKANFQKSQNLHYVWTL